MGEDICAVCGIPLSDHVDKQHEFNLTGQLVPKVARKKVVTPHPGDSMAVRVAVILHQRGLIADAEMDWILTGSVNDPSRRGALGNDPDRSVSPTK